MVGYAHVIFKQGHFCVDGVVNHGMDNGSAKDKGFAIHTNNRYGEIHLGTCRYAHMPTVEHFACMPTVEHSACLHTC